MPGRWTDIFPKRQLFNTYTQSTAEAVDVLAVRPTTLRLRTENMAGAGAQLDIFIEEAIENEDSAYVANTAVPFVTITVNGVIVVPIQTTLGRFFRIRVQVTLGGGSALNAPSFETEMLMPGGR